MSLIRNLDNLRPMKDKQPSQRLDAVIEVVNAINLARGAEAQGCDSYVSTEYVSLIPDIAWRQYLLLHSLAQKEDALWSYNFMICLIVPATTVKFAICWVDAKGLPQNWLLTRLARHHTKLTLEFLTLGLCKQGRRCKALPYMHGCRGWTRKMDASNQHIALERAFAFAAGDEDAGKVSEATWALKLYTVWETCGYRATWRWDATQTQCKIEWKASFLRFIFGIQLIAHPKQVTIRDSGFIFRWDIYIIAHMHLYLQHWDFPDNLFLGGTRYIKILSTPDWYLEALLGNCIAAIPLSSLGTWEQGAMTSDVTILLSPIPRA